jgi:hypothetical protein
MPLKPLSDAAALQTFNDITDDSYDSEEKWQLLRFTDNMPLAVDLVAHLVDYEGISNVLARWEVEKTSILSTGHDISSNLDASIAISLTSPRITPGAKDLLSLLSILPDGLSDTELIQSKLPIQHIRSCKATLLATSLAYIDDKKRLRSLTPIREHVRQFCPPPAFLTHSLRKHFHSLLGLYQDYSGAELADIVTQITLNLANLHEVLKQGLHSDCSDLEDTIWCTISLSAFYRTTRSSGTILMDNILAVLPQVSDHYRVKVAFITEALLSPEYHATTSPQLLIAQGISHCEHLNDLSLVCESLTIVNRFFVS